MLDEPMRVGMIGCGNICGMYLANQERLGDYVVVACSDLDEARARDVAGEHGIPRALTTDALLADDEVEAVLNITPPASHYHMNEAALQAGKHVYTEKPLTMSVAEGRDLLDLAEQRGLKVGCAPDTVLGGGIQSCREIIESGRLGAPTSVTGAMLTGGPEGWHPRPDFFYQPGGGPLFDMGPYYVTALVHLMGPVRSVVASAGAMRTERVCGHEDRKGEKIPVNVPTHYAVVLEFVSGAIGTLTMSWEAPGGGSVPRIEVYGTEGTLTVPDPNTFGGPVRLKGPGWKGTEWEEVDLSDRLTAQSRGLGLCDLAWAVKKGEPHRTSGRLALHVLEVFESAGRSSELGRRVMIETQLDRPVGWPKDFGRG